MNEKRMLFIAFGVFLVLTGLTGGAFNISKCALPWSSCSVLQKTAGWSRVPDETTFGRLFKETNMRHISELETLVHTLRKTVWQKARLAETSQIATLQTLWIDVDSSAKTVCGKQEGTANGYNPDKKGAYSYHPQLALCTHTRETSKTGLYR